MHRRLTTFGFEWDRVIHELAFDSRDIKETARAIFVINDGRKSELTLEIFLLSGRVSTNGGNIYRWNIGRNIDRPRYTDNILK